MAMRGCERIFVTQAMIDRATVPILLARQDAVGMFRQSRHCVAIKSACTSADLNTLAVSSLVLNVELWRWASEGRTEPIYPDVS